MRSDLRRMALGGGSVADLVECGGLMPGATPESLLFRRGKFRLAVTASALIAPFLARPEDCIGVRFRSDLVTGAEARK